MDGLASLNIADCVDDESLALVAVSPTGLTGSLVIKHVCIGDKSVGFVTVHRDAENPTGHQEAHLLVLLERELGELGHLLADNIVVLAHIRDLVIDLPDHVGIHEHLHLLRGVEDGVGFERFG